MFRVLSVAALFVLGVYFSVFLQHTIQQETGCRSCGPSLFEWLGSVIITLGVSLLIAYLIKKKSLQHARSLFWGAVLGIIFNVFAPQYPHTASYLVYPIRLILGLFY